MKARALLWAAAVLALIMGACWYIKKHNLLERLMHALNSSKSRSEGYANAERTVRFGDSVTLWSPVRNTYLKTTAGKPQLQQTEPLLSPDELISMSATTFTLQDPQFPYSTRPVSSGDTVMLQSSQNQMFVSLFGNVVGLSPTPSEPGSPSTTLFRIDTGDANKSPIAYGASIVLSTTDKRKFVTAAFESVTTSGDKTGATFVLLDRFGAGVEVEWSRQARASQSSTSNGNTAARAIDSNSHTFSETAAEQHPWLQVDLPQSVQVSKVVVVNLTDATDAIKKQMYDFTVSLLDADGIEVAKRTFETTSTALDAFPWNDVYQVGKTVRIERIGSNPSKIQASAVRVYGAPVETVTRRRPVVSDLTSSSASGVLDLKDRAYTFSRDDVVPVTDEITVAFSLQLDDSAFRGVTREFVPVFVRGTDSLADISAIKAPGIWVNTKQPLLRVLCSTSNDMNDGIDMSSAGISYKEPTHIAVTISHAVAPETNGWKLGSVTPSGGSTMVLFNTLQRFYYRLPGMDAGNFVATFGDAPVVPTKDLALSGYIDLGNYVASYKQPRLVLYINGVQSDAMALNGKPIMTEGTIRFNPESLVSGQLSNVKIANYAMPAHEIKRLSSSQSGASYRTASTPGNELDALQCSGMSKAECLKRMRHNSNSNAFATFGGFLQSLSRVDS